MLKITLYEVWSEVIVPKGEPKLEGTYAIWNAPGTRDGAVQEVDRLNGEFYNAGVRALVTVKEVEVWIDLKHCVRA